MPEPPTIVDVMKAEMEAIRARRDRRRPSNATATPPAETVVVEDASTTQESAEEVDSKSKLKSATEAATKAQDDLEQAKKSLAEAEKAGEEARRKAASPEGVSTGAKPNEIPEPFQKAIKDATAKVVEVQAVFNKAEAARLVLVLAIATEAAEAATKAGADLAKARVKAEIASINEANAGENGKAKTTEDRVKAFAKFDSDKKNAVVAQKTMVDAQKALDDAVPNADAAMMAQRVKMLDEHVTGLAISGGGIRSGTFAIGFLQGLSNLQLLSRFDYLSTVSGGGYAGGWLAAWLKREGDVKNVEKQLDYSRVRQAEAGRVFFDSERNPRPVVDEEPEPLRHLRAYSSYLFPRPGLLTADTWTVLMIWARNVTINLLLLFPLAMLAVLALRLGLFFFNDLNADEAEDTPLGWVLAWLFLAAGVGTAWFAFFLNARALPEFRTREPAKRPPHAHRRAWLGMMATFAAAYCLTVCSRWHLWHIGEWLANWKTGPKGDSLTGVLWGMIATHLDLMEPPSFLLVMGISALFMGAGSFLIGLRTGTLAARFVAAAMMAGASGGFLFVLVLGLIRIFARHKRPDLMATFAVPGALMVVLTSLIVEVAIAGRTMKEGEREWWARFGAHVAIFIVLWLVGMGATLYLPALFLAAGPALRVAIASGWLGTTALGVLTGKFVLPKLQARGAGLGVAKIASLAPPIFLIGLLGLLGLLASYLLNVPGLDAPRGDDLTPFAYYLQGLKGTNGGLIVVLGLGFGALSAMGLMLIDVNLFSLNAMYQNRLIRCYLGASRPMSNWRRRWSLGHDRTMNAGAPALSVSDADPLPAPRDANEVTGFDPEDDLPLSDLRIGVPTMRARVYWGPYLLINTTLNLVAGKDLAWRDRKGDSFTLSPLFCGAKSVGYARVEDDPETGENLTLGRAVAISGAAVDPNMRSYQSPALTALLTIFNARLGSWMQNPLKGGWRARGPKLGGALLMELLGKTDGTGDFVHLSDGGHFDNLGVYELIRRRCRYIVALDAGDEMSASGSNLATLVRLCRIDFGIRIQLETEGPKPSGPEGLSRTHVSVGRIRYDDADQGQLPGVLVYVRISMTGDEPPDLQYYASRDTNFPHQPTDLRQSFDEEQFECYRCLGDHIASSVFSDAVNRVHAYESEAHAEYVPRLFAALQGRWNEASETQDEHFIESTQAWIALQRDLRSDPNLARLSRELYPELLPAPKPAPARPHPSVDIAAADAPAAGEVERAELHVVSQMVQIMENTWLTLGLRGSSDMPMNRGWVNVFRRWVNTPAFQRIWPVVRTEYGTDFVQFCQEELHLRARESRVLSYQDSLKLPDDFTAKAIDLLSEEFRREWPAPAALPSALAGTSPEVPTLKDFLRRTERLPTKDGYGPPVWFVVQDVDLPAAGHPPLFVAGIVLAANYPDFDKDFPGYKMPHADAKSDPAKIEFFAWMRCGYRSSNLGAPCVRQILGEHLPKALGVAKDALPTLWARYPRTGEFGDDDAERETWLNFLGRFNFRRDHPTRTGGWKFTLLRRPQGRVG